ncbi:MAG: ABC transporter ATP-binding protein/permease [Lachnospiraceae bacterium]|nr:ABC transporter ATP-binding protein/permease [Lachnospiraceae bacterium]
MEQGSVREAFRLTVRAWKLWWKHCPKVICSMTLYALFKALSPYVTIWFSAQIINELAGNRDPGRLTRLIVLTLLLTALLSLITGILEHWKVCENDTMVRVNDWISMEKMNEMDYEILENQASYDLYTQMTNNDMWGGWGIRRTLSVYETMLTAGMQIAGGAALSAGLFLSRVPAESSYAFLNHPLSIFLILAGMLLVSVSVSSCANRGNAYWGKNVDEMQQNNRFYFFYGFLGEDRKRAAEMRIYQQEKVCASYAQKMDENYGPRSQIVRWGRGPMGLWMAASEGISRILTGLVYLFVCLKAWAGAFGVGSVTQYVGAITNMFLGISRFLQAVGEMRTNARFVGVAFEFLDLKNESTDGERALERHPDEAYEIEFCDVSFHYPGSETWVLRHVNLKLSSGSHFAIVGENGSGKTTFIKLLCRLYDPVEGQILLNGTDIRSFRRTDYMAIFSVVFQDFKLFAASVGENVAGSAKYDRAKVQDCIERSGFAGRLASMPDGLDTSIYKDIDQNGVEISGGEAQKIAIARALYKDALFIIMDEPTAALDPIAEAEIYAKFNEITGERTSVYISHRLSSCKFCDTIAVFQEGRLIQLGSHEQLMADAKGKYQELWNMQAQYYQDTGDAG